MEGFPSARIITDVFCVASKARDPPLVSNRPTAQKSKPMEQEQTKVSAIAEHARGVNYKL